MVMQPRKYKPNPKAPRQALPLLDPQLRARTPDEVALGFTPQQVCIEAQRCLQCAKPTCVEACPLHIDIKRFIARLAEGDWQGAHDVISEQNPFPGVCGRVCQHELFCERACIIGKKWAPVAIGSLERFAADHARSRMKELADSYPKPTGKKVALIGSGPASLIVAYDLVRLNYRVTVFEALHQLGGVLAYGIPNFRLPREILHEEIARLGNMGVEFVPDFILGKTATIYEMFEEGYEAIFVGTGAGLPYLMGIPGENLVGVYTANEFLTRVNLMEAYKFPDSPTPVRVGKRTVVVGGGNSAMDAARWAVRLGSETTILYRRGRAELKARIEEIQHAEEEGIRFQFLSAPVALYGDGNGLVKEMECIRMELGEPDHSGRRSPVPIPGSEYRTPAETVIAAIGQAPNPTLQKATPQLLTQRGKIVINEFGETSIPRVYAGGDVARGGSTVILAMKDGRTAAQAIHDALCKPPDAALSQPQTPENEATAWVI
jgi:glutamate synthase (NADPH/NADH) small chain